MPSKEENARNGLPETDWRDAQYDMLYLPVTETVRYHYDFNGNRTATVLPDGRQINYLYYGSGHLHQISLDDEVITDIERDKLHREIFRTQGKLASRYELDPLGRLKRQIATLNDLTEGGKGKNKVAAGYNQTAVKRSYGYGRTGNLTHSTDQRTGTTHFEYDKLGRITKAGSELFAFDPAHNILDIPTEKVKPYPAPSPVGEGWGEGKTAALLSDDRSVITDNRLKTYNGTTYYYDNFGNLIHRELADGEVQNYFYDLHDQLVKAEIFKKDGTKETWAYSYDALGRRIGKGRLKDGEVSDGLEEETGFVWDGSHLLQEVHSDGRYTYIYTDPGSYEPLAQVRDWTTEDGESRQQTHYFHCDQIGIPREMTDKDGNLLWFGNYTGWGRLKEETRVTDSAYQPFRLQNQYADRETGLHYNFFRYYEPDAGRFVNQDPIGLWGGENLYFFAPNGQIFIDPFGLWYWNKIIGTAQKTGTTGHRIVSIIYAHLYAMNPKVKRVTLDLGYKRLLSGEGKFTFKWGPRPDVGVLYKDGSVKAIEVASKTDKCDKLKARNDNFQRGKIKRKPTKVSMLAVRLHKLLRRK